MTGTAWTFGSTNAHGARFACPAFEAAVLRAGVPAGTGANNLVRSQHACHHEHLINRILKGELGFTGSVISDWGGTYSTYEAARLGLDVEMGTGERWDNYYLASPFLATIRAGHLSEELARDKARRNLSVMVATGVLDGSRLESRAPANGWSGTYWAGGPWWGGDAHLFAPYNCLYWSLMICPEAAESRMAS